MVVLTRLGPPEEGVRHKEESTSVYVNEKCLGKGVLYISEARCEGGIIIPHYALNMLRTL